MANEVRLIDANAVYQKVYDDLHYRAKIEDWEFDLVINYLDAAPTIDSESLRPKGKWTLNRDGSGTCGVCHRTRNDVWDMDNWDNFCSHCGADMREG